MAPATFRVGVVACWAVLLTLPELAIAADAKALAEQVQIRRTQYGVPHILAPTLEAAAFGLGYCQGEDHSEDIVRGVIAVRGQLAETFGQPRNAEDDFRALHYRTRARAVENYHNMDADYRCMIEGFTAGLNYYNQRHRDKLAAWVVTVGPHDIAAYQLAGMMRFAFDRSGLVNNFLRAQGVTTDTAQLEHDWEGTIENEAELLGSNMWAFAPGRTRDGHTILMGNPHQPWAPNSTYYEAHMTVPGKLNFYGATFLGGPILRTGFNEFLGWSHTVNSPDLEEIYELSLDPARADCYLFDGDSVPLRRDDVTVRTKRGDELTSETRTFWHAPLGPVIHRTADKVYVLRSACYENYDAYGQWLKLTQTKDWAEFKRTVEINHLPMFNICYADRVGNIFYLFNGTVPNLPHPAHGAVAVPAARSADVWTRFHTTSELPQLFNPPGGYVQNSNSPPYFTNLRAPMKPEDFPAHLRANDLSLRTQHSLQLIDNDKKFSLDDVVAMKHDQGLLLADRVKGELIAAVKASQPSSEVQSAVGVLENWDNSTRAESRGGVLFANWWSKYNVRGQRSWVDTWSPREPMATPRGLADKARAVKAFADSVQEVTRQHGRADVAWGEVHRIRKGTKDRVDLAVSGGGGDLGAFRVLDFTRDEDGKRRVRGGDSWVFAVEFTNPPTAYTVVGYSQSNVEGSPHFHDQAPLFANNQMKPAAFTEAQIAAQLEKAYRPGEE